MRRRLGIRGEPEVPIGTNDVYRVAAVLSKWKVVLAHLNGALALDGKEQHAEWLLPVDLEMLWIHW